MIRPRPAALAVLLLLGACRDPMAAENLPHPAVDLPAPARSAPRTAVFAMGCFWCAEGVFERVAGVIDVKSGYAGGTAESADYELVSSGRTGHAESIKVTYDPNRITYGQLLEVFFTTHDPTTKDRQGPDWGHQYRSAIFYDSDEQRQVAAAYIKQLGEAHAFNAPIVTTLEPLTAFYNAEAYHQDYVKNHPDNGYVRMWFPAKEKKLRDHLRPLLKPEAR